MTRTALATPDPPELPSPDDIEDAEDILFAHTPRQVAHARCACGADYPCDEVRWARLVTGAA